MALMTLLGVLCVPAKGQMQENKRQEQIAARFLKLMEEKNIQAAQSMIDPAESTEVAAAKRKLPVAVKAVTSLLPGAYHTIMAVGGVGKFYRKYRCRYHIDGEKQRDFYQVDVYFANASSTKIGKLVFKDRTQLWKEQMRREQNGATPPPVAPPVIRQ